MWVLTIKNNILATSMSVLRDEEMEEENQEMEEKNASNRIIATIAGSARSAST